MTNDFDAFRILSTCLNILYHVKQEYDDKASFGFLGARKETDRNDSNTQRFRIYSQLGKRYFSPQKYIHVENVDNSSYLILDRSYHSENSIRLIQEMFDQYYHGI